MPLEIQHESDLTAFNTFGLTATAERLAIARSEQDVIEVLDLARKNGWRLTVIGGGSNVVLTGNVEGLVLVNAIPGILFEAGQVVAGGGESWHQLVLASLEHGLSGIENLSLIPGSVGAAPIQNIGAYGAELESVFECLTAIDRESREPVTFSRSDCRFGYRDSIFKNGARDRFVITSVRLRLNETFTPNLSYAELRNALSGVDAETLTAARVSECVCDIRRRKLPDPARLGNAGSFFKNPVVGHDRLQALLASYPQLPHWPMPEGAKIAAGWLIDQCGLRGERVGGAAVFERHALVLVNLAGGTPDDVLTLADRVRSRVKARFDLELEIEPTLI